MKLNIQSPLDAPLGIRLRHPGDPAAGVLKLHHVYVTTLLKCCDKKYTFTIVLLNRNFRTMATTPFTKE